MGPGAPNLRRVDDRRRLEMVEGEKRGRAQGELFDGNVPGVGQNHPLPVSNNLPNKSSASTIAVVLAREPWGRVRRLLAGGKEDILPIIPFRESALTSPLRSPGRQTSVLGRSTPGWTRQSPVSCGSFLSRHSGRGWYTPALARPSIPCIQDQVARSDLCAASCKRRVSAP